MAQIKADEITKLIREQIENFESKVTVDEVAVMDRDQRFVGLSAGRALSIL